MYMNVKKHKPPSRERYEEKNPNWTVRMPKDLHDALNAFLKDSNQSRRDFMGIALRKQNANFVRMRVQGYKEGHQIGHNKGYKEGYQHGEAAGYQKGYQEGLEKGEKIGIEKGEIIGLEKGKDQGRFYPRYY